MLITYHANPWPHFVLDDYLPDAEFQALTDLCINAFDNEYQSDYDGNVLRRHLDYDPLSFNPWRYIKYFNNRKYTHLKKFVNIVKTEPNFIHSTHVEAPFKILSSVLYVSPEENNGTRLFSSGPERDNLVAEVEWKPNRMLIFAGQDNVTWHDYTSSDTPRYTFNHFMVDPSIIENELYKALCF